MAKYTNIPGNVPVKGADSAEGLHDPDLEKNFPALWEFLTLTQDGDRRREVSTLLVFVQDARLTLCLNDRQENRSAFVSGPTLREAMVCLEENLAGGTVEWRHRMQGRSGSSRKSA